MMKNPILEDLRNTREKLLTEAGGTLEGLVAQLQRHERLSGREFVQPKAKTNGLRDAPDSELAKKEGQPATAR